MRNLVFIPAFVGSLASAVLVAGCGSDTGNGVDANGGVDSNLGSAAFEIISKDVTLQPGDQVTYCYYFHPPNTTDVMVNKWVSDMSAGSHHAILYVNPGGTQPPDGTSNTDTCGVGGGTNPPVWTYATQTEHQEEDLPPDDGNGKPLAQKIPPHTAAYFQLHYLNGTDAPLTAHIDLKAYALAAGTAYTQTDAYVTYNYQISSPAGQATPLPVTASCPLPAGVKFWNMSTHSHKQSTTTDVKDGSSMIFQGTDWEHPGAKTWMATPFYTFTATKLTWECSYKNNAPGPLCSDPASPRNDCSNRDRVVNQGLSAVDDEMCMATGYFFPSTGPKFYVAAGGQCQSL